MREHTDHMRKGAELWQGMLLVKAALPVKEGSVDTGLAPEERYHVEIRRGRPVNGIVGVRRAGHLRTSG